MEFWKPVALSEYASLYEASSFGRVRRTATPTGRPKFHVLKPSPDNRGYPTIVLCANGKPHTFKLHRVVAMTFLPGGNGLDVNHKDANKENNRPENLEWVTKAENNRHARDLGLHRGPKGITHPRGHRAVTNEQVREIRALSEGKSSAEVARLTGISYATVWNIVKRNTWAHL